MFRKIKLLLNLAGQPTNNEAERTERLRRGRGKNLVLFLST